jgi:N utilization substance protein B
VDPVERAVLRLGAYELTHHLEIPYRVVINEAVELAKIFGAEQGHKFVNGVLDQVAKKARRAEVQARS